LMMKFFALAIKKFRRVSYHQPVEIGYLTL